MLNVKKLDSFEVKLVYMDNSWMSRLQTKHPQNQYQEKHECVDLAYELNESNVSSQNI